MKRRKTIMLLVTYGCNLRCTYCYEPKTAHKQMTAENAKMYIASQIELLGELYDEFEVQFMGGEPLMVFPVIKEVSEWLWKQNFNVPLVQIFIPTNGTLLNDEMKAWFEQNKKKVCLGLSFDGNRLMQNINRSNSFAKVDLDFFLHTWPQQSVKMTVSPDTIDSLYEGVMFLYQHGLHYVTVDLAMGKRIEWTSHHLGIFAEQLQMLVDYYLCNPKHPRISLLDVEVFLSLNENSASKKCGCGEHLVCVDCDGTTYACHLFAPITASQKQAAASRSIDFFRHEDFISMQCRECSLQPLCTQCYGMNYLCTGDVAQQFPFTCEATKIQFLIACNLQLQLAQKEGNSSKVELIEDIVSQIQ